MVPPDETQFPNKSADEKGVVQFELEPIEQSTYALLVRAAARLEAELNRVFRPVDLTAATYNILLVLQDAGYSGRSCGDISEQLVAEVPDMTRLLDRLERLGYVARERSSIDRRMVKVTITAKGLSILEGLKESVRDCHIRQLGHLGQDKLTELSGLLRVILNRGQTTAKGPSKSGLVGDIPSGVKHVPH
ncbi:MAG: MarR family winged helix-turn-helix transcriptional regulator [Pseudomonadota bacterium]|jgi:DNA-binding MarR family transcriptional regulator